MKRKQKPSRYSVHVTITIPVDLKDQMDQFSRDYKTNWSRVARQAFRKYLKRFQKEINYEEIIS